MSKESISHNFGHFSDGGVDCVDDDLDFVIHLGGYDWPRFVLAFATFAKQSDLGDCYVGSAFESLLLPNGRYERLLCLVGDHRFLLPVSIEHTDIASSVPLLGNCSGYGHAVPCPVDVEAWIGGYKGGCVALPNTTGRASTLASSCSDWMLNGLNCSHVLELRQVAKSLDLSGFLSMERLAYH